MSSADDENQSLLRQRPIETDEKEIEAVKIENNESSLKLEESFKEAQEEEEEKSKLSDSEHEIEPVESVRTYPRNLQPVVQRPSFVIRQFRNVKTFFLELLDFLLLFLTTLFNPMADVNTQVREHNQRKTARDGKFYSSCKPTSFPVCGPSS